jgi:hypothetical protein
MLSQRRSTNAPCGGVRTTNALFIWSRGSRPKHSDFDISNIPTTGYMNHHRFNAVSTMLNEIARSGRDSRVDNPVAQAGAFVLDSAAAIVASPFKIVRERCQTRNRQAAFDKMRGIRIAVKGFLI